MASQPTIVTGRRRQHELLRSCSGWTLTSILIDPARDWSSSAYGGIVSGIGLSGDLFEGAGADSVAERKRGARRRHSRQTCIGDLMGLRGV